jgi:hypothetical protein
MKATGWNPFVEFRAGRVGTGDAPSGSLKGIARDGIAKLKATTAIKTAEEA